MDFFVIEIDSAGRPMQLLPQEDFEDAKNCCAAIARENGVSEYDVQQEILECEDEPGVHYTDDDVAGVWVIATAD